MQLYVPGSATTRDVLQALISSDAGAGVNIKHILQPDPEYHADFLRYGDSFEGLIKDWRHFILTMDDDEDLIKQLIQSNPIQSNPIHSNPI